ncbi:MAG: hypothetical protein IJG86_00335 [Clostridia bacterium]|nr:hypothetical protein [Clostridia bacterium]
MRDDFAVFILTHGRPNRVVTLKSLAAGGYTGKWYIVIDNEDDTEDEYRRLYGDRVLQFDKKAVAERIDTADLSEDRRTIVYARNACFELAKEVGVRYFLELDDDYTSFMYRFPDGNKLGYVPCKTLDNLFESMIDFLNESGAKTVAFAQGGDFIGGIGSGTFQKKLLRKAMNTFFCDVENPFEFVGRINEDVNTYTLLGNRGELLFTTTEANITQIQTQSNGGGMTDVYLDSGTFLKSFYTVIFSPQCTKVGVMGDKHKRLHHVINWNACAPKILSETWKKRKSGMAE